MSLVVLRSGLDTVEVSYGGSLSESAIEKLDALKAAAQGLDAPKSFYLGLLEFGMLPVALPRWRWRFKNPLFTILARPKAPGGGVLVQVRFSPFAFANEELEALTLQARIALDELGSLKEIGVSRGDVCADVQGLDFTPDVMKNMVSPASYRATHGTEGAVETFVFGKRTLLRIYNKTKEIAVSGKLWLPDLWHQHPDYDPSADVWRIEYQAAGDTLKQLGITSSAALFADPGALLDAGLRWSQLRVPDGKNRSRWPEDERWTRIREATFGGIPLKRTVKPSSLMSLDRTVSSFLGNVATAGAYFGETDYMKALQRLSYAAEAHMMRDKVDFEGMVTTKQARILTGDL